MRLGEKERKRMCVGLAMAPKIACMLDGLIRVVEFFFSLGGMKVR